MFSKKATKVDKIFTIDLTLCKGGFFSESEICFSNLSISQKNYSKKLFWACNLNNLFNVMGGNFKFQAQDSFLEYFFGEIGRLEKRISLSEKKALLVNVKWSVKILSIFVVFLENMNFNMFQSERLVPNEFENVPPGLNMYMQGRQGGRGQSVTQGYCYCFDLIWPKGGKKCPSTLSFYQIEP